MSAKLPYFTEGEVVKGFGRGSKELGVPTANFPLEVVELLPEDIVGGVYHGWASVDNGPIFKMVMSIGWNPFYKNTKKSMETHIIKTFKEDFYGCNLKIVMLGYQRPMKNFNSLDELITAIKDDISEAESSLDKPDNLKYKEHNFFSGCTRDVTPDKQSRETNIGEISGEVTPNKQSRETINGEIPREVSSTCHSTSETQELSSGATI